MSGCVAYGGYGYNPSYDYGYYDYPCGRYYYNYVYPYSTAITIVTGMAITISDEI